MEIETSWYAAMIAVEAVVAWIYCEHLFTKRRSFAWHLSSFVLGYALLFGISCIGNTTLNSISFGIVNYLLITFNYQGKCRTAILHAAFLSFVMLVAEVIVSLVINFFGYDFSEYTHSVTIMIVLGVWSKLLYLVLAIIGARAFFPRRYASEEPMFMVLFCVLPVVSALLAALIIYIGMHSVVDKTVGVMMAINVSALLLINVLFLSIYNHIQKMNAEHLKMQLSIQKEKADTFYYQALQEQADSQRILIHDIKNHLRTIEALAQQQKTEAICKYIHQLDGSILSIPHTKVCNEPILNLLLLRFTEECQKQGVVFQCDIRDCCLGFMDASSITTLFGNLLSNALEAAAISVERHVELTVKKNEDQAAVVIMVVISCDAAPVVDAEGRYISQKRDAGVHGFGLKSVQRMVRKYNGLSTTQYSAERRQFHHIIRFPLQEP